MKENYNSSKLNTGYSIMLVIDSYIMLFLIFKIIFIHCKVMLNNQI